MNRRRKILGILASLLLAGIGTVALVGSVQSAKDEAVADEEMLDVYVVESFVPKGAGPETITESLTLRQVPSRLLQPGAVTDLDAIGSNVAATDLHPGDQLIEARLVAEEAAVDDDIEGKVMVSARLAVERAAGGALRQGDLVGVHLSFESVDVAPAVDPASSDPGSSVPPATGAPSTTRLEFQQVLVTGVGTTAAPVANASDEGSDEVRQVGSLEYVVTLALSPEQAERFVFAVEFGRVWLSLDPSGADDDGTRPVTFGNVFEEIAS